MAEVIDTQLLVLGAGPGGYAAAFLAADKGMKVGDNHFYLLQSKMKQRKRRQVRAKMAVVTQSNGPPNPTMAVAKFKTLTRELGGLKNLKQLVDVLSE